mmetsp:Transcript_17431/g.33546  ORF Transcript_17431/g.33546 Transcript_17431/m.33546 type:complete len:405 (+) Transcript_17431:725-1939(+)
MKECDPQDLACAHDDNGHGTHCAATSGGEMFGVAKNAQIHAMKVLFPSGSAMGVAESLEFVMKKQALRPAVVSASLGGFGWTEVLAIATQKLTDSGVLVVVAAGNDGEYADNIFEGKPPYACAYWPANIPSAITVGATGFPKDGISDDRASYSSWDSTSPVAKTCVDIFAPGSAIESASNKGDNASVTWDGTSMATPHVSGAVALLLEENPAKSAHEIEKMLKARATTGAVGDAKASPNLLLYVGRDTTAPAPSPQPNSNQPCSDTESCAKVASLGHLDCSSKSMEFWIRIHCAKTCGVCPEQAPVPQPTPQPTLPKADHGSCLFLTPHNPGNFGDVHKNMPLCDGGQYSWHCVTRNNGRRVQCPSIAPYMCADKACDDGKDYCCEDTQTRCDLFGGLRRCETA